VADFLAKHPDSRATKLYEDLSDEVAEAYMTKKTFEEQVWQLLFDSASRTSPWGNIVAGVLVVLVSPQNYIIPHAFSLAEPCYNNIKEYNALLIGMQIADEIGIKNLDAYSDSKLIVNQVRREYEVRHENLVPYHNATIHMAEKFRNFYIAHVPRQQNAHADVLASLAASLAFPAGAAEKVLVYSYNLYCPKLSFEDDKIPAGNLQIKKTLVTSEGPELRDWRFSYIDYALYNILPDDPKEAVVIRRKALKFYYSAIMKTLYRWSHDGIILCCLSQKEAKEALKEAHDGMCGAHQPGPKLGDRLWRLGYYLPKMIPDAIAYAK